MFGGSFGFRLFKSQLRLLRLPIGQFLVLMLARITSSSRPTVVTKYPRAQNLWPEIRDVAFDILYDPYRALPFMYPMICATEYFGGSIWTYGRVPAFNVLPRSDTPSVALDCETLTQMPPSVPKAASSGTSAYTDMVLALPGHIIEMIELCFHHSP